MNISLKKTIAQIERCLPDNSAADANQLRKMYDLTLRLQSQLLSVIYDMETFDGNDTEKCLAQEQDIRYIDYKRAASFYEETDRGG